MGFSGQEAPFFFLKPADAQALVVVETGETGNLQYPRLTKDLHHEIELVVVIGTGGKNIRADEAHQHIFGYAVGLDMTRRDLQIEMAEKGRPWCIGKSFDHCAAIGAITPKADVTNISDAEIHLQINGSDRQHSQISELIWNAEKTVEKISEAWDLCPGDLIYTGTPQGVASVTPGDLMVGKITGLQPLKVKISA
jgi:fumarylpyruvate hydrolase